jgi:hypothetical protein
MKVSFDRLNEGVRQYVQAEILPSLPSQGIQGFGVGFAATLAMNRIETILRQLLANPAVAMLGIVDESGMIDLDAIRDAATQAMPGAGIKVPIIGQLSLSFDSSDVDKLYTTIKG